MQRLMLTPGVRFMIRAGLPVLLICVAVTVYLSDPDRRLALQEGVQETRRAIEERPEFMVKLMSVDGAEGALADDIRQTVPFEFPVSSFDLDLADLRTRIGALEGVKAATVRVRPGGVLQVQVERRTPVAVWRHAGGLTLIDPEGAHVSDIEMRTAQPDLPLLIGAGVPDTISEALELVQRASALGQRFRGVQRVGERRWDILLDRDQRILLPETDALQALDRVIALEGAQDVLSRDIAVVDMRLSQRPTIRMSEQATREWWQIKETTGQ
jgi:cell division protein FtsQ